MVARCFIVLLSLIVACNHPKQQNSEAIVASEIKDKILKQTVTHRTFSDPATKDKFIITLQGDSVKTGSVTFEIYNSTGEVIYYEKFDAIDMINYNLPEDASPANWDSFILNRIDTFFEEKNFKSPAIQSNMELDSLYINIAAWNDIKSNKESVGFYYLLGKEDGRWIAYSKRLNKVMLYYNCC